MCCALIAALVIAASPGSSATAPTTTAQVHSDFESAVAAYLVEYEARDPLFADSIGIHTDDDRLPDYSATGQAQYDAWQAQWRARFAAYDPATMSPGDAADRRALLDAIDTGNFEEGTLHPQATDPTIYVGVIGDAAYQLTGRPYAPVDERMRHVVARMRLLPQIVADAEQNLTRPPLVYTQRAIQQNQGNLDFYQHDVAALAKQASPSTLKAFEAELPSVVASLQDLQRFLSGPLLARSDGNPRVGKAVFDRDLQLVDGTDTKPDVLIARARANFQATRARMLQLALPLDRTLFPSRMHTEKGDALIDAVVGEVLDKLADDHPDRNHVFQTAQADVDKLESFLRADPVVVLPDPDTLHVVPTPAFQAGFSGAALDPPGPFTPLAGSYYDIDPIPSTWTQAQVTSHLRDYNDYEMQMLSLHEAVPGHYVQFRYDAQTPSLVRRIWSNGSFVEGWAVYTEGMMLDAGFGGGDPKLRLFQLKWRLREYSNAIIDSEFHTGALTHDQCIAFLKNEAFQDSAQAEGKWYRLQLSHDQLSSYFVGLDAIEQAQAAEKARLGSGFTVAAFNARLLRMGSVEPRFVLELEREQP